MTILPRSPPWPRRSRLLGALCLALILCAALLIVTFRHGRDQAIYTLVARALLRGGMPYRDAWDFKPPGIFLLYALARALFGGAQWGIRILEVGGLLATVAGLRALAKHWWGDGRIGLLAGALCALVHVQLEFWHSAQPETFGGMLTVAALCAALLLKRSAWQRQLLAGLLFGLAGLLKPPLAGGGAMLALWLCHRLYHHKLRTLPPAARWRRALAPLGWVLLGGVLPFALTLGWFAANDAWAELHHTLFVFTPHYTALGWRGKQLPSLLFAALVHWLFGYSSALCAGLLCLLLGGLRSWTRKGVSLLAAIIAVQLVGVALQAKFFAYHFAGLWPLTALLAALGLWPLWRWTERRSLAAQWLFVAGLAAVATLRSATKDLQPFHRRVVLRVAALTVDRHLPEAFEHLASVADVDAVDNRAVAEVLRRRLPSDAPLFVWGFEPQLYDMAERPAASRFIYNVPQRAQWQQPWARRTLMDDLRAQPPAAIVVMHHDALPMVTGDSLDSAAALANFDALMGLLQRDYLPYRRIGDHEIYFRRELATAPAK